jgi:hypothetical protein
VEQLAKVLLEVMAELMVVIKQAQVVEGLAVLVLSVMLVLLQAAELLELAVLEDNHQ